MASKKKKPAAAEVMVGEAGPETVVVPAKKTKASEVGDLVKVVSQVLGLDGHYEVVEVTDEGIIIAPMSGETHQRMRVQSEDIRQIFRGAA